MFAKNVKVLISLFFIVLAILACNLPGGAPAAQSQIAGDSPTPTFTAIASETPTSTPIPVACTPSITTSTVANVRTGPGQVYAVIGSIPQGGSANVSGKSFDGSWWYIDFAAGSGGHAWISTTVTTSTCIPNTLASIAAPPTPILPTSTVTVVAAASATPTLLLLQIPPLLLYKSPTPTKIFIPIPLPVIPLPGNP